MIKLHNVSKIYTGGAEPFYALRNVSLTVAAGSFCAVVGRSGSGKTTLLNLVGLLDRPNEGKLLVGGEDLSAFKGERQSLYRSRTVGFVFQSFNLEGRYTVYENVEMPLAIARVPRGERRDIIMNRLEQVGLAHKEKAYARTLSGGEKQRVCIARALSGNPSVILADEPCGNLDSQNSAAVMDILRALSAEQGKTVLLVTHSEQDAAQADRLIRLHDGEIAYDSLV